MHLYLQHISFHTSNMSGVHRVDHAGIDKSPCANHCAGFWGTKKSTLEQGPCPRGILCLVWDLRQMGEILPNNIHLPVGPQTAYHELLNLQLNPFPISLRHLPTTRTIFLPIVHINHFQIVPLIWSRGMYHPREQFKGREVPCSPIPSGHRVPTL